MPEITVGNFLQNKGIQDMYLNEIKKRDKRYIEQYVIKAIIEYNKQNITEEDNIIIQDLIF